MASMKGKVIAVTGGYSGIGFETAKLLAARGAKVSIADFSPKLEESAEAIRAETGNSDVIATLLDVRNQEAVSEWIEETVKRFGQLDGAANIAGVHRAQPNGTVETEEDKDWQFLLDINLTGVMHCLRAELPKFKSEGGSVVNAASILSVRGWAGAAGYSASKHGVLGLTRSVAKEVGKRGIRVNCVAPGFIDTPMLAASTEGKAAPQAVNSAGAESVPLGRVGKPSEVAGLVVYLLSDDSTFITGACINVDGGMSC